MEIQYEMCSSCTACHSLYLSKICTRQRTQLLMFNVTHWYLSPLSRKCRSNFLHAHITSNRILKLLSWSNSYVSILHVLPVVVVVRRVFERCDKKRKYYTIELRVYFIHWFLKFIIKNYSMRRIARTIQRHVFYGIIYFAWNYMLS